ncbi:hypothetical protein [Macrococcus capreoli]|uniref:hypothetical protein n=1 Tax=Macrococcus capreoli TaxID=2982690 RepID=UPI0021D5E520|nr:hypothetical protein [Macrococcus sp. TMW 2.2395]MCU7557286.1 hypothetical protein [Macrococcus sp. TMW 2.2395]
MSNLKTIKLILITWILLKEIKKVKSLTNDLLKLQSKVTDLEYNSYRSAGITSTVNKYGAHQQMHDKNGDLMMSHSVLKK